MSHQVQWGSYSRTDKTGKEKSNVLVVSPFSSTVPMFSLNCVSYGFCCGYYSIRESPDYNVSNCVLNKTVRLRKKQIWIINVCITKILPERYHIYHSNDEFYFMLLKIEVFLPVLTVNYFNRWVYATPLFAFWGCAWSRSNADSLTRLLFVLPQDDQWFHSLLHDRGREPMWENDTENIIRHKLSN